MRVRVVMSVRVLLFVVGSAMACLAAGGQPQVSPSTDNLVLITLDGARTEEIFGGLDLDVLQSTMKDGQRVEDSSSYQRFWAPTADQRRRKLMPFFWRLVSEHGSIAGNQQLGSAVRLGNRHWFSYPGYAEILLGEAHDDQIASNDPIRNPHPTVLEGLRTHLKVPAAKVATFAGWSVFDAIVEHTPGATFVNAGVTELPVQDPEARWVNEAQREAVTPWDGTRFDAFTFRLAMRYMASARPRVLYLAFDETDDWAHDGRYDRVLETYHRTDAYLNQLWDWLQQQPDYRGRTHVLITTDHGRGRTREDWRNHGAKVVGAEDVWIAFASPLMSRRGEWTGGPALSTSQIAATIASWLGADWTSSRPGAGRAIR